MVILKSKNKNFTNIKKTDINKIVVSNNVSFGKKGFKYFIGYKDANIRTSCIFLPKISAYGRDYIYIYIYIYIYLIKDDELLEKYNEI